MVMCVVKLNVPVMVLVPVILVPRAKKKLVTNAVLPNWPESKTKNMVRKWYHSDICKVAFFNSLSPLEIINLSLYFLRI